VQSLVKHGLNQGRHRSHGLLNLLYIWRNIETKVLDELVEGSNSFLEIELLLWLGGSWLILGAILINITVVVVGVEASQEGVDLVASWVTLRVVQMLWMGLSDETEVTEEASHVSSSDMRVVGIWVDSDGAVWADIVRLDGEAKAAQEVGDSFSLWAVWNQILADSVASLLALDLDSDVAEEVLHISSCLVGHLWSDLSRSLSEVGENVVRGEISESVMRKGGGVSH
jgi:hypothetical protein